MRSDTTNDTAPSDSEIQSVVFGLTKSIAGPSNLETFCSSLAVSLRRVVSFDALELILHDPVRDELRLHGLITDKPFPRSEIAISADRDPVAVSVWREQKPVTLPSLETEARVGDVARIALGAGLRSLILVPLSNADRWLGVLGFGFIEPYQPDDEALQFLQRVVSTFAVAVDGYLARSALQRERERMHALFEITTALVSKLPMDELLHEISLQLSKVVAHDAALVALLNKTTGQLHLSALDSPGGVRFELEGTSLCPEGLPAGEAIATPAGCDVRRRFRPLLFSHLPYGRRSGDSFRLFHSPDIGR